MFQKSISDYLANYNIDLHSQVQNDLTKFEFLIRVTVFHICDEVLNGSVVVKDWLMRYNQGDGLTLVSTQYHGLRYNVRLKDVFSGSVQLFE